MEHRLKVALLTGINSPLVLTELEPCDLQYGQVYVRMLVSGICGAQLQEIRGDKGHHFPRLMGHEGCGIVERIGPGVKTVKTGEKVVLHWRKGDGIESDSPRYLMPDGKQITSGQVTTFSTHSIVSENRCTAVPDDAPNQLCALLGCGLSTALGTIEQEANLKMGESVLIIGCGGLGLNLIRAARLRRAGNITAVDTVREKELAAISVGATKLENQSGSNFDVVIDTSGDKNAIGWGASLLGPSGRLIMVGQPRGDVTIPNAIRMFSGDGQTIKATQGGGFRPHIDIPRYVNLWRSGQLDVGGIVTSVINLLNINDGIALVQDGAAGRVMIDCQ